MGLVEKCQLPIEKANNFLSWFQWLLLLVFRCYVAYVFIRSGMQKIGDWETTMMLFEYEYKVPLLSFQLAAYLSTFGELVFPIFLFAGLGTRWFAILVQIINVMAVISYYSTLVKGAGLVYHMLYGTMLCTSMVYGGGKLSLDHWIESRFRKS